MSTITYTALTPEGFVKKGSVSGTTVSAVKSSLQARHYIVLSCEKEGAMLSFLREKPLSLLDLAEICFHLAAFDEAGLPLLEGLEHVQRLQSKKAVILSLEQVSQAIQSGLTFSQALKNTSKMANEMLISLVNVGEKIGSFHPYLRQAETIFRWESELKNNIRQALVYPCLLFFFLLIFFGLTFTVLVPNLQTHLQMLGIESQSFMTTSLLSVATFCQDYAMMGGIGAGIAGLVTIVASRYSSRACMALSKSVFSIPYIGPLKAQLSYLVFFQNLSIMMMNKLDLLPSLRQAASGCSNIWLQEKLRALDDLFLQGHSFSKALETLPWLPPFVLKYVQLGEKTGNLAYIIEKACQHELVRIKKQLTRLTGWIQPTLVMGMGVILIWIILAILVPIYDHTT